MIFGIYGMRKIMKREDGDFMYGRLPEDVQSYIKSYFHLWERLGLKNEPEPPDGRPEDYYIRIRRCPRGVRLVLNDPIIVSYRRQDHCFQWELMLDYWYETQDFWVIHMFPQWKNNDDAVTKVMERRPYFFTEVTPPASMIRFRIHHTSTPQTRLRMEFMVTRQDHTSAPTRQQCLEDFVGYIRTLSRIAESSQRKKNKNCL